MNSIVDDNEVALFNVVLTLVLHYLNVVLTWSQRQLSYTRTNLASEKYTFAERLISFILPNEKIFFTIY